MRRFSKKLISRVVFFRELSRKYRIKRKIAQARIWETNKIILFLQKKRKNQSNLPFFQSQDNKKSFKVKQKKSKIKLESLKDSLKIFLLLIKILMKILKMIYKMKFLKSPLSKKFPLLLKNQLLKMTNQYWLHGFFKTWLIF